MSKISDAEARRLLAHLRQRIAEEDLAEIEDELRGEFAEEFLREPEMLAYFEELSEELAAGETNWKLRVIPHAHLRMVQRGLKITAIVNLFRRFVGLYQAENQIVFVGHFAIVSRLSPQNAVATIRVDVDLITDAEGQAHVVTVYLGRGDTENTTAVELN